MRALLLFLQVIGGLIIGLITRNPGLVQQAINFLRALAQAASWLPRFLVGLGAIFSAFIAVFQALVAAGAAAGRWIVQVRKIAGGAWIDPFAPFIYLTGLILGVTGKIRDQIYWDMSEFDRWFHKNQREKRIDGGTALKLWSQEIMTDADLYEVLSEEGYRDTDMAFLETGVKDQVSYGQFVEFANRTRSDNNTLKTGLVRLGMRPTEADVIVQLRETPLDIANLVNAVIRGHVSQGDFELLGRSLGYTQDSLNVLVKSAGQPLSIGQMLDLWNRGEVKETDVDQAMLESNLNNKYIAWAKKLRFNLLGASDYIRFAVREVYDPTQRAALQLDEDYPAVLSDKLQKIGYSDTDAKDAWAAHWELPSPSQVFTMLHYGLFDNVGGNEYVKKYLKAADYSPEWRDYMLAISYNPLTRVDARRAFKIGAITEAQLLETFKKEGYTPEDAQILVDFTKADVLGEKRADADLLYGPIKTTLLSMYKARRIDRETLETHLKDIGYTGLQVEMFVQEVEFAREVDHAEDIAAALKGAYIKSKRNREDTKTLLMNAGYSDGMAEQVLEPWDLLRAATEPSDNAIKQKDLTKAEILASYADDAINLIDANKMLMAMGYDFDEANALTAHVDVQKVKKQKADYLEMYHTQFVADVFDLTQLSQNLDQLGIPFVQKTTLMTKWAQEKRAKSSKLTVKQIEDLSTKGLIDELFAFDALAKEGYSAQDRQLLWQLWTAKAGQPIGTPISVAGAPAKTKLTRTDYETMYYQNAGDKPKVITGLKALGYNDDDIQYILKRIDDAKKNAGA